MGKFRFPRLLLTAGLILALTASTAFASPTLKQGSHGHDVLLLQQKLAKVGYKVTNFDGVFGKETERAVAEFQRDQKIRITGIVNNATWRALKKAKDKPGHWVDIPVPAAPGSGKEGGNGKLLMDAGKAQSLIRTAKSYLGTPYLFGGSTPKAFDCSGYVQYVFAQEGYKIPRTADIQYDKVGQRTRSKGELVPGDLVFFETYEPGASHVGIYLGGGDFIHASSVKGVTISNLSDSYYAEHYYGGKHLVR